MTDTRPTLPRLGILGRHPGLLAAALAQARALGLDARGSTDDDTVTGWIASRSIDALVIGGGVVAAARERLEHACRAAGVRPVPVASPGQLGEALRSLLPGR